MPLGSRKVAVIGSGAMGEALIRGLLKAGVLPAKQITATDNRDERLTLMRDAYGVSCTKSNVDAVAKADVVILAVKPQIFPRVLDQLSEALQEGTLVVSIAAGITIHDLESKLGPTVKVIRAMPNTPVHVDAGVTALAAGEQVGEKDRAQARAIFEAVGTVVELDETLLDGVTGLSGSGPAYVFMIIEALSDAGVRVGLPRYQSQALAAQTVLGSAKLLIESGEHPGVLKDRVTSPGGTAIAGLATLEAGGLRTTLINAVVAATERSVELGGSLKER